GAPGWFVRPRVAWRYTDYQLSNGYQNYGYYGLLGSGTTTPFTQKSPSRSLPIVSLDSGLVFDRDTSLFGHDYTQTLEPRLYYLYVPYRDQNNLPLFDSSLMSFDYWQLFSTNQFSGADRQMNANNLTAAITTRLLDDGGVERLSASFGQIRYFTPQRVQMPNSANTSSPATDWSGSSYVAQLDLQLSDRWRASSSYQWSPNTRHRHGDAAAAGATGPGRRGQLRVPLPPRADGTIQRLGGLPAVRALAPDRRVDVCGTGQGRGQPAEGHDRGAGRHRIRQLLRHPAAGRPQLREPGLL